LVAHTTTNNQIYGHEHNQLLFMLNVKLARSSSKRANTKLVSRTTHCLLFVVFVSLGKHARDGQEFMFRSGFPGWYAIDSSFTVASSTSRRNSIANKNKKLAERERFLPVRAGGYIDGLSETSRPIFVYTAMPVGDRSLF
jgi:hypothetical protein